MAVMTTVPRLLRGPAKIFLLPLLGCLPSLPRVEAFDITGNMNLAVYWGQNSYGGTHATDTANWQKPLAYYCQDTTVDIIPIAFLEQFYNVGGLPSINLANTCSISNGVFPGTVLANCSFLAGDIQTCQAAGKVVTLSIGGANGGSAFVNDTQGAAFAHTVWDLFLGGSSTTRPFGNAVLDGIDLDIQGGTQTGFVAFLTTLRDLMDGGNKQYYITTGKNTAPQCTYPDDYIGATLNAFPFDAVFVQFYNNSCGLDQYNTVDWNFGVWDTWAKTISPNPNVKVYIGAPASPSAAPSGYVDASTLATIIAQTMSTYTSFGGVSLWDASQAYANGRYDIAVKNALTTTPVTTTTIPLPALLRRDVPCTGASPWQRNVAYTSGQQVTYNGHLWMASSWSYNDAPGGAMVWADDGLCTESTTTSTTATTTATITVTTTTTTATTTSTAPTTTPTPCAEIPTWQPNVAYTGGQQVSYNGHMWVAKYWTYNDVPGGAAGVWTDLGSCTTSLTCVGVAAWQSNVAYTGGQQVIYNGHLWTASWWTFNDVPGGAAGVWIDNGPCTTPTTSSTTSSPTNTASTTATTLTTSPTTDATSTTTTSSTSSTTDTSTTTTSTTSSNTGTTSMSTTSSQTSITTTTGLLVTAMAVPRMDDVTIPAVTTTTTAPASTPTTGGCSGAPVWQRNVAYTAGQQVIYNGHRWTAKWWSYNDVPGGAAGVWTDNGACVTSSATVSSRRM